MIEDKGILKALELFPRVLAIASLFSLIVTYCYERAFFFTLGVQFSNIYSVTDFSRASLFIGIPTLITSIIAMIFPVPIVKAISPLNNALRVGSVAKEVFITTVSLAFSAFLFFIYLEHRALTPALFLSLTFLSFSSIFLSTEPICSKIGLQANPLRTIAVLFPISLILILMTVASVEGEMKKQQLGRIGTVAIIDQNLWTKYPIFEEPYSAGIVVRSLERGPVLVFQNQLVLQVFWEDVEFLIHSQDMPIEKTSKSDTE